jgi:tetratricopeptide (TPR) repeat protein
VGNNDEAAPHYERAFQLAEATADRERYFIVGSYYGRFLEDGEKAAHAYEALLRIYPEHSWGTNNLFLTYTFLGRHTEAAQLAARAADLRPRDFGANVDAAQALAFFGRDLRQTRAYVARARELVAPGSRESFAAAIAWLEVFPALDEWFSADPRAALQEVDTAAQRIDSLEGRAREELANYVAHVYLVLGRLDAAERTLEAIPASDLRHEFLARVAFIRRDDAALRNHLGHAQRAGYRSPTTAVLLARAGMTREAHLFVSGFRTDDFLGQILVRGELALAKGERKQALTLLKDGTQENWSRGWSRGVFLLGSESLAGELKAKGDLAGAIRVLEGASEPQLTHVEAFSLRNRFQLAKLYREAGREEEARKIESELLNLLAVADSDHPILLELQRLRTRRRPV